MDKYHQTLNEIDYHDHTYEDANKRKNDLFKYGMVYADFIDSF